LGALIEQTFAAMPRHYRGIIIFPVFNQFDPISKKDADYRRFGPF
jgi:hypothetical protein